MERLSLENSLSPTRSIICAALGVLALIVLPASPSAGAPVADGPSGDRHTPPPATDCNLGFDTSFTSIPVSDASDGFDPLVFHKRHFNDDEYRVIFKNDPFGIDETQLWKTPDFSSWTKVANSIAGDADMFADHIVLPDGTFVLYQSSGQAGNTSVWTGKDLTNLTKQGAPIPEPDGGVFYDEADETVHIYTEDSDNTTGLGSDKLSHWTTPDDDLLNATKQPDAVDVTDRPWHTGDPDIIEISGTYYMFTDNTTNHPYYRIAVLRSQNLYDWTLVQKNINPQRSGGDMVVTRYDGSFVGFTEYDNYAQDQNFGVGQWEVSFLGDNQIALTEGGPDGLNRSFDAVPGQSRQAIGTLQLQPDRSGATLTNLTLQGDDPDPSGVEEIGLFGSSDSSFDPSKDTQLATKSVSGSFPSEVTFSNLGYRFDTDRYVFLTDTLSESATGEVSAFVEHEDDIAFDCGYIGAVNGTEQSSFSMLALSSSTALPVQLANLDAQLVSRTGTNVPRGRANAGVRLQWKTISETENAGFAIQRRQAGDHRAAASRADWQKVDYVESKAPNGNTTEPKTYRFTDEDVPFAADSLEYRLRQVDIHGSESFSEVVTIERPVSDLRLLSMSPNPAHTRATVRFAASERQTVRLELYDTLGRRVRTVYAGGGEGRRKETIELAGLSSGVYFLRLKAGPRVRTEQLTVVR